MLAIQIWMTRTTKTPARANEAQWDLLRTFESIARLGSVTAAAKALAISQSTASRHLLRLEEEAGSPLLAIPTGELWIVVHRGKQRLPKVRAVITWLESILCEA